MSCWCVQGVAVIKDSDGRWAGELFLILPLGLGCHGANADRFWGLVRPTLTKRKELTLTLLSEHCETASSIFGSKFGAAVPFPTPNE
jgi:hypothetical protein